MNPEKLKKSSASCHKCGKDEEYPTILVRWGVTYFLCSICAERAAYLPTGTPVETFLSTKETLVDKNIREARERRAKGYTLWKDL